MNSGTLYHLTGYPAPCAQNTESGVFSKSDSGSYSGLFNHLIDVVAWPVPCEYATQMPTPMRVGVDVHRIVTHLRNRRLTFKHHVFAVTVRRVERAAHTLNIGHRMADHISAEPPTGSHTMAPANGNRRAPSLPSAPGESRGTWLGGNRRLPCASDAHGQPAA